MTQSHPSLSLSDLTFIWPDGESVFSHTNFVFPSGRVGLVGLNGSGKSTLLRLIAGELSPESGSVTASGEVGYLRQDITLDPSVRVDDILGIHELRNALHRIETGDGSESDFALVDNNWDIEESALSTLHRLGLEKVAPDTAALSRTVGTLSGGETVLLGLTATLLKNPQVLLLDEPTNKPGPRRSITSSCCSPTVSGNRTDRQPRPGTARHRGVHDRTTSGGSTRVRRQLLALPGGRDR